MVRQISFSQMNLFWTCPKTWYLKYIQKVPTKDNLVYAFRGSAVHHCLETYFPKKTMTMEELRQFFDDEWKKYKLYDSKLRNAKEETWQMVMRGVDIGLNITDVELAVSFDDIRGFIDVVDKENLEIWDWKTSTRSQHNELEYMAQVKLYAYLYHRKFGVLPKYTGVKYLKYSGKDASLGCVPTMEDIKIVGQWLQKTQDKMEFYKNNVHKLPRFNKDYFFCPYKHLWVLSDEDTMDFTIEVYGNFINVSGTDEYLNNYLYDKYTYELDDAVVKEKMIKRKAARNNKTVNINLSNTKVHLWDKYKKQTYIGFLNAVKQTLNDYAVIKKKSPMIQIKDMRIFDETVAKMPEKLLTGKILMEHQDAGITAFVKEERGCVEAATGGGKSLIIADFIRRKPFKTLIVIHNKELLYQLKDTIEEELGVKCGVVGDGVRDIQHITVATIQTLNRNLGEFSDWLQSIRNIIIDEAHHAASDSYFNLFTKLKNVQYRLGTTATFDRDDGHEMKLKAIIGTEVYSIKSQALIKKDLLMNPDIMFIKYEVPKEEKELMEQKALGQNINPIPEYLPFYKTKVIENNFRNAQIQKIVNKHEDQSVLILIKNIAHGELLNKLIEGSEYINGTSPKKFRETTLNNFKSKKLRVLVSSVGILSEGFNMPSLSIIVNASANVGDIKTVQIVGRILRKHKDKTMAIYYDFMDDGTFLARASLDRMKKFKSEGYKINLNTL